MRVAWDESLDYEPNNIGTDYKIRPISFGSEHKQMLSNLHLMVSKGYLAIPKKFEKLIISRRTAESKEYSLDKEQTTHDNLLDAIRMSLKAYNIK